MRMSIDALGGQQIQPGWLVTLAAGLSLVAAAVYLIIGTGLAPDDIQSPPAVLMLAAGAAYLIGAMLILRRDRRLLTLGAILNPLVIAAFVISLLLDNAEIEALSVISKLAQAGLEIVLLVLLWGTPRPAASERQGR